MVVAVAMMVSATVGLGFLHSWNEKDLRHKDRPYKRFYTVYRPDDPRIENLKARPQYYNPEGTIPAIQAPEAEKFKWLGERSVPKKADGSFATSI